MLQNEVAVQQHGFHFRQEIVVAIDVAPARLHHAHFRIGEVVDGPHQEVRGRAEIGVEHRHQFARRGLQAFLQCAGLVPMAVGAVMILDRVADGAIPLHQRLRRRLRYRRWNRPAPGSAAVPCGYSIFRHFFDQALEHVPLVVQRKLDGHGRKLLETLWRLLSRVLAVLEVSADHVVAMHAVDRKNRQNSEVRNQHCPIEPGELMDAGKGVVGQSLDQGWRGEQRQ